MTCCLKRHRRDCLSQEWGVTKTTLLSHNYSVMKDVNIKCCNSNKIPWKEPGGNSSRNDKLMTCKCEFPNPNQGKNVNQPTVSNSRKITTNIFNTLKTFLPVNFRCSCQKRLQYCSKWSRQFAVCSLYNRCIMCWVLYIQTPPTLCIKITAISFVIM